MRSTDALSRVARTAALAVVLAVVLVCSSASGATEVAVPGTSVFRWPSMTWSYEFAAEVRLGGGCCRRWCRR